MGVSKLGHYSIRTRDLAGSRRFYMEVLGLRDGYRPPFNFPGHWLYFGDDESDYGVVHLIGADPDDRSGLGDHLGERPGVAGSGTGDFDHIAFLATGWPQIRGRCQDHRVSICRAHRAEPETAPGVHRRSLGRHPRAELFRP